MDPLGLLILLVVAAIVGALGEFIGGVNVPGGWLGSMLVGFLGAWIGSYLLRFGPAFMGIQVIPAILGAAIFVLVLRVLMGASRSTPAV
jgi:uncharacterized membrane protein YeaQ/YmgE (transglycosylase-associated protein family)